MGRGDHAQLSAMSTTAKVLQVLQLFSEARTQLRAADAAALLGLSTATIYRYMADLEQAGLIERTSSSHYVLGPAIVELDRQIRIHDPLIAAATDVMEGLSERTGGTALLCRLHGLKVMCVHEVRGPQCPPRLSYERGRAMPLYRGATSKIILAHLSPEALLELMQRDAASLHESDLPTDMPALISHLAELRREKVCITTGEVDRDAKGWGVALHQGRHLLGSLSVVMSRTVPNDAERISDQLLRAMLRIEGRLQ